MTSRFVDGILGNDANDGLAAVTGGGHGPKLTLNGAEDSPVAAGDVIYVRPAVYRELWTWDVSGGNAYVVGTVTLTNGSTTVQGAGTLWLANVAANYMFHCTLFASGADGVTNGTATFTSAAGNFQASMVGYIIQINTKGAYKIANVGAANSITLSDPNGLGWPAAGAGLTYSVMSGMGPFDVLSVTDNTHLELTAPWNGPTLTGLAYITYNPIRAIGDVTGQIWGVGGTVRITGANAGDTAAVRADCIDLASVAYRVLRGFACDLTSSYSITSTSPSYITVEDCSFQALVSTAIIINGAGQLACTFRRCVFYSTISTQLCIVFINGATVNNSAHLVSNCEAIATAGLARFVRIGGGTVRNCVVLGGGASQGVRITTALTVGQTISVQNGIFQGITTALFATAVGEITPNFNTFFSNGTNYTNTTAGASDLTYPALFTLPLLFAGQAGISGYRLPPPMLGELSQWSPIRALAGFGEAPADVLGIKRPGTSAKNSWGGCAVSKPTARHSNGANRDKFAKVYRRGPTANHHPGRGSQHDD